MVTELCGATIGAANQPIESYHAYATGNQTRKAGKQYFVLIGCNVNIADPTDLALWDAAVTAGDIKISPKGKIVIPVPTLTTSPDIDDCGGDTVLDMTYQLQFSTYQANDTDAEYWNEFFKNYSQYRVAWFDCKQNFNTPGEYVDFIRDPANATAPVGAPGFSFTVSVPPHPVRGDGNRVRWETTMEINLDGNEIIRYGNVPGLFTALAV